jgi:hypothetical protein
MADPYPPSEFGGKNDTPLGVQPHPHALTTHELLSAIYRTGEEEPTVLSVPDAGEAFSGLLPADVQRAIRESEGALDKGQVWEEMQQGAP